MENENTKVLKDIDQNTEMALLQREKIVNSVDGLEPALEGVLLKSSESADSLKQIEENTKPKEVQKIQIVTDENELATNFFQMLRGRTGEKGDKGDRGEKGDTGEKGDVGEKGDTGEQGIPGLDGLNGIDGEKGENGLDGRDGIDGKNGINGKDGKNGSSDTPKQVKDKLLKVGFKYEELSDRPNFEQYLSNIKQASKTVSLVELDDVNLAGLTQTNGKYNLGSGGGGAQAALQFKDEGSNLGAAGTVDTVDFTGSAVTASRAGNTVTVNVTGGSGSPAGSDTWVQYNDSGSFGAQTEFSYDYTTDVLTVGGIVLSVSSQVTAGAFQFNGTSVLEMNTLMTMGAETPDTILYLDSANEVHSVTLGSGLTLTAGVLDTTGGGGSPAGSTTEIQYNNAGSFGASANFSITTATNKVNFGGASNGGAISISTGQGGIRMGRNDAELNVFAGYYGAPGYQFGLSSETVLSFSSSPASGDIRASDTGISRLGAASIALGNGSPSDTSGSLTLSQLIATTSLKVGTDSGKGLITYSSNTISFAPAGSANISFDNSGIILGQPGQSFAQAISLRNQGSGTNYNAGDFTFTSGAGTGSGTSGSFLFRTADVTTSGSTPQAVTTKVYILGNGNTGFRVATPTARIHSAAGTAAAGTAPLKIDTGTAMTTPEDGAFEYHSSHLYFTIGSTRYQLDQQGGISGSLTATRIPFASGSSTLTDSANFRYDDTNDNVVLSTGSGTGGVISGVFAAGTDRGGVVLGRLDTAPNLFVGYQSRYVTVNSSDTILGWSSVAATYGDFRSMDVGFSRLGANSLALGDSLTVGDRTGSLSLATLDASVKIALPSSSTISNATIRFGGNTNLSIGGNSGGQVMTVYTNGSDNASFQYLYGLSMASALGITWGTGASTASQDTGLYRTAAGVVKVTNASTGRGSLEVETIQLGAASDTTIARVAAGIVSIEGEVMNGYATTATAVGTTALTITSAQTQYFTGTTTQTVTLPTTSVIVGQTYRIVNNSTGIVTVQSSGANTIQILGAGMSAIFTALAATPTTAANWSCALTSFTGQNIAQTASSNAATVNLAYVTNTITNNSAATLTITFPTAGAIDGEMRIVRVLDFSAAAQTITWVNTQNSTVTATATSNGSTTLPVTVGFQYNSASSLWRCIAAA